ncbi:MAG: CRISPR-associated endonuclease Cas2 [Bacteroidia bacterium]|nr:CRISPR-associated endonuclease Cas2 [Bacteroidia bacterium]
MENLNRYIQNAIGFRGAGEHLVVYDITNDKERNATDKVISGYGFRIQKSVFQCRISKSQLRNLIKEIEKLNIQTGNIRIFKLDANAKKVTFGNPSDTFDKEDDHAYIV